MSNDGTTRATSLGGEAAPLRPEHRAAADCAPTTAQPAADPLMDRLRARRRRPMSVSSAPAPAMADGGPAARPAGQRQGAPLLATKQESDFEKLPEVRALSLQRDALGLMGLAPPFFRRVDGPPLPATRVEGRESIRFTSYDYLGLNSHEAVREAAAAAIRAQGVSAGASRLVGGERAAQGALEAALAAHYEAEDAVVMVSGHATNVTTIGTLLGPEDLVLLDSLGHNSSFEGARLSGATRRIFPHNDLDKLEALLAAERARHRRALVVVEGLYSMDGDSPDLARLVTIKERFGAWLMVDEAHALGVCGETGRGLFEAQGVDPGAVDIWMGTLSKTLASCGGYIAGSAALVSLLRYRAPGFVFSVGLAPALAAAALAALQAMHREPGRVGRLVSNGRRLRDRARAAGLDTGTSTGLAVTPVVIGDSLKTVALSNQLAEAGFEVAPIVHPAVPERAARLRFFVTAEHTAAQIDAAIAETARLAAGLDAWKEAAVQAAAARARA
ncbi:MAG: aminotransferase class I/II-fold pyridoxal phosphate-dependent enzyme [Pseudomonadota bacterium]